MFAPVRNVHFTDPVFVRLLQYTALATSLAPKAVNPLQLGYEDMQADPLNIQALK